MKRLGLLFFLILACAVPSLAQLTTVTGTVNDANGIPYAGARVTAQLVFAGTPVSNPTVQISNAAQCKANGFGSAPCQVPFSPNQGPFSLDNGGNIPGGGITLQDNTQVAPSGTLWLITVNTPGNPPPLGTGPQTCAATVSISGASQDLSANFSSCAVLGRTGPGASTSATNTFTAPQNFNADISCFKGPNPYVDVRCYGVRAVNINTAPQTTGTISSGSNLLTVASSAGFQKNDGISQVNAGTTNCATPPAAPTVTPSLAASMTGTGYSVPGATGATEMSYSVAARSQGGCVTAASPVTSIVNANNSLGQATLAITSQSNLLGTVTVTVGSTAAVASGFWGNIVGSTDPGEFNGDHTFTVVDGTHLSYTTGLSSLYLMSSTTATGGTINYWTSNHIGLPSLPAGTNMYQFGVYRCINTAANCALPANAANYSLVYLSYPAGLPYTAEPTYNTWDDYGSTMTPTLTVNFGYPWWFPPTPPATNTNDLLTTTITNIAGNTLTLAANASNTATATGTRFDNAPGILAANAAALTLGPGGGGTPYFPAPVPIAGGFVCYPTSSYLSVTKAFNFAGPLCWGDTVQGGSWNGNNGSSVLLTTPSFTPQALMPILCRGANPCMWRQGGRLGNFNLQSIDRNAIGIFDNSGTPTITENLVISTSAASNDYMSIPYYYYNNASGTGQFGGHFTNFTIITGPTQPQGATHTPGFISKNGQSWVIDYFTGSQRAGFYLECNAANTACSFDFNLKMGEEVQGPVVPLITVNNASGGNRGGRGIYAEKLLNDSGSDAYFANASTAGTVGAPVFINGVLGPGSTGPLITGKPWSSIFIVNYGIANTVQLGVNTHVANCGQANQIVEGCQMSGLSLQSQLFSAGSPTIASGFGTSPSVTAANGSGFFTVNVGTGGVASSGVLTMPITASHGWNCPGGLNITAHAGNRADDTVQTTSTTTTVTVQNQTKSTGAAVAWTASDVLQLSCTAN